MGCNTWVLIADGARAQFYASNGGPLAPALSHDLAAQSRRPTRDIESDRPGRSYDSTGAGRHGMEPPTHWKTREKKGLARAVADELQRAIERKAFDRLLVVAPPEMLGDLRQAFDKDVRQKVVAEIEQDLTRLSVHQLARRLSGVLRPRLDERPGM